MTKDIIMGGTSSSTTKAITQAFPTGELWGARLGVGLRQPTPRIGFR
jgi:hypothetical protein